MGRWIKTTLHQHHSWTQSNRLWLPLELGRLESDIKKNAYNWIKVILVLITPRKSYRNLFFKSDDSWSSSSSSSWAGAWLRQPFEVLFYPQFLPEDSNVYYSLGWSWQRECGEKALRVSYFHFQNVPRTGLATAPGVLSGKPFQSTWEAATTHHYWIKSPRTKITEKWWHSEIKQWVLCPGISLWGKTRGLRFSCVIGRGRRAYLSSVRIAVLWAGLGWAGLQHFFHLHFWGISNFFWMNISQICLPKNSP